MTHRDKSLTSVEHTKDLRSISPELAEQWRNGDMTPSELTGSSKVGGGPACATVHGASTLGDKSLLAQRPELAAEWHATMNHGLGPQNVLPGSGKMIWWQCKVNQGHIWRARLAARSSGQGCPFCSGKRAHESNSLATLRSDVARLWHSQKNALLLPTQVTCGSYKKVWWQCEQQVSHEWQAVIKDRTSGSGCPYCNVGGIPVTDKNRLSICFPEIAAEWHPSKNRMLWSDGKKGSYYLTQGVRLSPEERPKKNRRLRPSDVSSYSSEFVWWQCKQDKKHVWYAMVTTRTYLGAGCPQCADHRLATETSLQGRYPRGCKQWHPTRNLPLKPSGIRAGSGKTVWWRCFKSADHVWQAPVNRMVAAWRNGNNGCPFCVGKGPGNDLASNYPQLSKQQWHTEKNLPLEPSLVTYGSTKKVWWRCPISQDHVWQAMVYDVVNAHKKGNSGCPICCGRRKLEQ